MSKYNRLHLIKNFFCCFVDMHLFSHNLSTIATISSLIKLELLPACLSCSISFEQLRDSLGSDGKKKLKSQKP